MLRHATDHFLANAGQDTRAIQLYLGPRKIQHTVRYTELAGGRPKPWLADYLHELTTFPQAKHDDQADPTSQALAWLKSSSSQTQYHSSSPAYSQR
jgi:hypothetical protein